MSFFRNAAMSLSLQTSCDSSWKQARTWTVFHLSSLCGTSHRFSMRSQWSVLSNAGILLAKDIASFHFAVPSVFHHSRIRITRALSRLVRSCRACSKAEQKFNAWCEKRNTEKCSKQILHNFDWKIQNYQALSTLGTWLVSNCSNGMARVFSFFRLLSLIAASKRALAFCFAWTSEPAK